jgi:hypothetical protein
MKQLTMFSTDNTSIEIRAHKEYYATSSGNTLPTFRYNQSIGPIFNVQGEDRTDMLSRNVGKNYNSTLHNIPYECSAHRHRG